MLIRSLLLVLFAVELLLAQADVPPSVLVLPAQNAKGLSDLEVIQKNPYAKMLMETVGSYLSKKNYDLKSLEGQKELDNFVMTQNAISGKDEDIAYMASLFIGADIYVRFTGEFSFKNVKVELTAYEVATGVVLGKEVATRAPKNSKDLNENIQAAANDAIQKLDGKIQNYWRSGREKGIQYKVIMNITGDFDEDFIEDLHEDVTTLLKSQFNQVVINVMTEKTIDVTVFANPGVYASSQEVYSAIRSKLKSKVGVKKNNITKKLILMDLKD